jgi:lipoprotein-releasing system permease protein
LKFPIYFSKKIAFSKDNKNNLSKVIVFIGRLSVALGIIVSLITVSTGLGSKKAIESRLANFSGHISVKSTRSNSSYNTSVLNKEGLKLNEIKNLEEVAGAQSYATVSGILRTEDNFDGVILKGVSKDFDAERFKDFMISGEVPKFTEKGYNNQVILSEKIANDLHLKTKDSIVAVFSKEDQKLIYRKFEISGIYKTDIKMIDDLFIIGDINHVRKIQNMAKDVVFVKSETLITKIELYDFSGKKIKESASKEMNISSLQRGNYLVKITDKEGNTQTKNLIKE